MSTFENKVALVTGGGTGIGKAIVEGLAAKGAKVVVTGRREAPLAALAEAYPEQVAYVTADVAKAGDPRRAVDFAVERFGGIDLLVNNAAVHVSKPLVETTDEDLAWIFGVNVIGLLAVTREAVPHLVARQGSVVNVGSVASAGGLAGYSAYGTSKAAVDHLTRVLAKELGPQGVRVNAVASGMTVTDMAQPILDGAPEFVEGLIAQTPLGRLGQPADIAPAALYLLSDDASWVTGQILQAAGGLLS